MDSLLETSQNFRMKKKKIQNIFTNLKAERKNDNSFSTN